MLCYFEGLTHEEAARHLGWASGTVKVRLVRGRKLLRERLDRRKIALGAGLLLLWKREAEAAPAEALVESSIAATKQAAARKAALGESLLSRFQQGSTILSRASSLISLACALLLVLGLVGSISWVMAIRQLPPHQTDRTGDLPANLMNVLAVDCR